MEADAIVGASSPKVDVTTGRSPASWYSLSAKSAARKTGRNAAVRQGRWKLVRDHPGPWELYDIEADRIEQHDLAPGNPTPARQLAEDWQRWAGRVGVISWDHMLQVYADRHLTAEAAED